MDKTIPGAGALEALAAQALGVNLRLAADVYSKSESERIMPSGTVSLTSLLRALDLPDKQSGYEAALTYFLDSPDLTTLLWGNKTFIGTYRHTVAADACDKVLDLTSGTFIPDREDDSSIAIRNTIEWIEPVLGMENLTGGLQDSTPGEASALTRLKLANPRDLRKGDIVKLFSLQPCIDVSHDALSDGPDARLSRAGELMMVGMPSAGAEVTLNAWPREKYDDPAYRQSIRLALYRRRSLVVIGGTFKGNPAGEQTWRGWAHVQFSGFTELNIERLSVRDHYGVGLWIADCWCPKVIGFDATNLHNNVAKNRYGYGVMPGPGTTGMQIIAPSGTNCRHLVDTGSSGTYWHESELAFPFQFGVPFETDVHGGTSHGLQNAPWGSHHNVRGLRFHNSLAVNTFAGDDSGGFGVASRGNDVHFRGCTVRSHGKAAAISVLRDGSITECDITAGSSCISLSSNMGVYARNNRLVLDQVTDYADVFRVGGGYGPYPCSLEDPVIVGDTLVTLRGGKNQTVDIFSMRQGAILRLEGQVEINCMEYEGTIRLVHFQSHIASLDMAPDSRLLLRCAGSTAIVESFVSGSDDSGRMAPYCNIRVDYMHASRRPPAILGAGVSGQNILIGWRMSVGGDIQASDNQVIEVDADGFELPAAVDVGSEYRLAGPGNLAGGDLARGRLDARQTLTLKNEAGGYLRFDKPPLWLPPRSQVVLAGSSKADWSRADVDEGLHLIFAGRVNLRQTGIQALQQAAGIAEAGWFYRIDSIRLVPGKAVSPAARFEAVVVDGSNDALEVAFVSTVVAEHRGLPLQFDLDESAKSWRSGEQPLYFQLKKGVEQSIETEVHVIGHILWH